MSYLLRICFILCLCRILLKPLVVTFSLLLVFNPSHIEESQSIQETVDFWLKHVFWLSLSHLEFHAVARLSESNSHKGKFGLQVLRHVEDYEQRFKDRLVRKTDHLA